MGNLLVEHVAGLSHHEFAACLIDMVLCVVFCVLWLQERGKRIAAQRFASMRREDLAHTTRLAVVGELTGSIAHEINQPLGAILSNAEAAELLLRQIPPPLEEVRHILADIRADDLRAHQIIKQVRALLAKEEREMTALSLNELVTDTLSLVQGAVRRANIRLQAEYADDSPRVLGDPVQVQQVLMNLILNALEAMTERQAPAAERELIVRTRLHRGQLHCEVLDRGYGVRHGDYASVFNSFFTTKPHGMGLGLTISRAIIDRHGGNIYLSARPGGGAIGGFSLSMTNEEVRPAGPPLDLYAVPQEMSR